MTNTLSCLARLSDDDLLAEVKRLADGERRATALLIASLMEVDRRRAYLGAGYSSLFAYCTHVLHLSEHAAYGRIEAARTARRFPVILELLECGVVTLTAVGLLAPHLTLDNHQEVLAAASHKSKREVEHLVARLRPQPTVPSTIRKLPEPKPPDGSHLQPAAERRLDDAPSTAVPYIPPPAKRPAVVMPLAPERYKVQFTVSRETYEKLRRAQDLLRHQIPSGDPAVIFDRALSVLLAEVERTKLAATPRPRAVRGSDPASRHIPAAVRREVWARDGGRCAFVGTRGRCTETGFLEFHHERPYAAGGASVVENLELRCRAHNGFESEKYFGPHQPWLARETRPHFS